MNWQMVLKKKYYDDYEGTWGWQDAFSKWGFGDNLDSEFETDAVQHFLEELGYEVGRVDTSIHNVYIGHVSKGEELIFDHSKTSYGKPPVEVQETDPEL